MREGLVVIDRGSERTGAVYEDGAAAEWFEHGDGDGVASTESHLLDCGLRGRVEAEDEVALVSVASQDRGVSTWW